MFFRQIIDPLLSQHSYLIGCETTKEAILFEPERDIERYLNLARKNGYKITAAADTHIHADYLSGLRELAETGVKVYASDEGDRDWKYEWLAGSKYKYQLLKHGDTFGVGNVTVKAIHTPGHTPEHLSFEISEKTGEGIKVHGLLTGDFVFVGDVGRPDLLESAAGVIGSAETAAGELFESIQKFKGLAKELMIWPSHGAGSACGKSLGASPMSTVGQELEYNQSLKAADSQENFVDYILSDQPAPPYYFGRMKIENKKGPALLRQSSNPNVLTFEQILEMSRQDDSIVLDGRDWQVYRTGHLKNTLFAPLDRYFINVTGSYIKPEKKIALIGDEDQYAMSVAALARIGLDNVAGYISPDDYTQALRQYGKVEKIGEVSVDELKEIQANSDDVILDVRNGHELTAIGQIGSAQNIPYTRLLVEHGQLPQDKLIHVYCRSGNRSEYAVSFLKNAGYEVSHVAGGIMAWMGSGYEVVSSKEEVKK